MAHHEIKTQDEARTRIARDTKDFLQQLDHDLGVFFRTWTLYEDLPLEKFRDATPHEDRILLPGMHPPIDVPNIVIQALGSAWHRVLADQNPIGKNQLSTLVHREALTAGAPEELADQLSTFVLDQYAQ